MRERYAGGRWKTQNQNLPTAEQRKIKEINNDVHSLCRHFTKCLGKIGLKESQHSPVPVCVNESNILFSPPFFLSSFIVDRNHFSSFSC